MPNGDDLLANLESIRVTQRRFGKTSIRDRHTQDRNIEDGIGAEQLHWGCVAIIWVTEMARRPKTT